MKRLKSTAADLRMLFEEAITARFIAADLDSCQIEDPCSVANGKMKKKGFDVLGVTKDDVVIGYIELNDAVSEPCRDFTKQICLADLVDESAPLMEVLRILADEPRVFVSCENSVDGIITWGDLQRAPVRMLLFGLVSLLEMQMLRLIIKLYPDGSWEQLLKPERVDMARDLHRQRREKREEIDLADCLQFCDKRDVLIQDDGLRERLSLCTRTSARRFLKQVEDLRDLLAHAQDLSTKMSWPKILGLASKTEKLIEACENVPDEQEA